MLSSFPKTTETDRTYNWVTENALSGRDWQTNSVFAKFNFKVERGSEMDYALAWKDLMSSSLDLFDGSFGLNAIAYGVSSVRTYPGRAGEWARMLLAVIQECLRDLDKWMFLVTDHKTATALGALGRYMPPDCKTVFGLMTVRPG